MNQILYVNNKKKNQPADIKKVILFFSIALIVVGVILVGQGSYAMYTNFKNKPQTPTVEETKPKVNIERVEDDIVLKVQHDKPIATITYQWNEEEEKTIQTENKTSIEEKITLPFGSNTLKLKVIDINGKETNFQQEYIVEGDGKPVIDLVLTKDNKIKITARDQQALQYISYQWNNGEPTKIEANAADATSIEQEIEIPLGQNTLKVEAINTKEIATTKELEVKGVKSPTVQLLKDGNQLIIRVEDSSGIERVDYTLNGKKYRLDVSTKNYTSMEYKQQLEVGENIIELTAYNKEGGQKQVTGRTTL